MASGIEQTLDLVVGGSIFLLVLSVWIAGVLAWSVRRASRANRLQERLGMEQLEAEAPRTLRLWHGGQQASIAAPAITARRSMGAWFRYQCFRAGWPYGAGSALSIVIGVITLSCGAVAFVTGSLILAGGVTVALVVLLRLYLTARISARDRLFETQLTDAMDLAARSLRAGHPLPGAFQLIAEETAAPVQTVFAELCQRHGMGASLDESLREIAARTPSEDMKLFATSVAIQMRAGGNLADLIDRLAKVVRERMRLNRRLRVLTSQTNMSKRVLIALPFLVFILFNLINPEYMSAFYETRPGQLLLAVGASGLAIGTLIMNRMAVLKY